MAPVWDFEPVEVLPEPADWFVDAPEVEELEEEEPVLEVLLEDDELEVGGALTGLIDWD